MSAELRQRLNYEIKILENARKEYALRLELLSDCRRYTLKRTKPGNSSYYYYSAKKTGNKTYDYLGPSDDRAVKRIKEARFLEEAIRRIERDIELMQALVNGFLSLDPGHINENLPETYRCEVPPVSELYEIEGRKWLARRLEDQKQFPENYPEKKTQQTSDRVKVKTISEVVLYEMIKAAGLVQIYELPLPMKDYGPPLYPDSTVLSPIDMKTEIIIEYAGRLDKPGYREEFARKLDRYLNSGYKLGVNLFFIYSDRDGNIDSMQIKQVIADIFGIRGTTAA